MLAPKSKVDLRLYFSTLQYSLEIATDTLLPLIVNDSETRDLVRDKLIAILEHYMDDASAPYYDFVITCDHTNNVDGQEVAGFGPAIQYKIQLTLKRKVAPHKFVYLNSYVYSTLI